MHQAARHWRRRLLGRAAGAVSAWLLLSCVDEPASAGSKNAIHLETRVSWATPYMPEVHVLFRNESSDPTRFFIDFGSSLSNGSVTPAIECRMDLRTVDMTLQRRSGFFFAFWNDVTEGIVPAHGWTHRSVPIGRFFRPPCKIPFVVRMNGGGLQTHTISIDGEYPPDFVYPAPAYEAPTIQVEAMLEDGPDDETATVRMLAQSRSEFRTVLWITDRGTSCEQLRWKTWLAPMSEESFGPIEIAPLGWAVFVSALDLSRGAKLGKACKAWIEISAGSSVLSVPKRVGRYDFPVIVSGEYSGWTRKF